MAEVAEKDLTFQRVRELWPQILEATYRRNARTQALLNSCKPLGIQEGVLVVGYASDLLREKMEKGDNLRMARGALEEVLGQPVGVRCVLTEKWRAESETDDAPPPVEDGGMVATALRDLGAQIVEHEELPPDSEG